MSQTLDPELVRGAAEEKPIEEVVAYLRDALGDDLSAYLAGAAGPGVIHAWIGGKRGPGDMAAARLRAAYATVGLLVAAYDIETTRLWLFGGNSRLDHMAPAGILRRSTDVAELDPVVAAAVGFAGSAP